MRDDRSPDDLVLEVDVESVLIADREEELAVSWRLPPVTALLLTLVILLEYSVLD